MAIVTVQIELIGESDLHLERMILLLAILQFAISTSKPPAPVALEGRLCLSGKPHEYKRSLVWLNLPPPTKLGKPRARVATALNLQSPAVTGAPLHPTSPPPKIVSFCSFFPFCIL